MSACFPLPADLYERRMKEVFTQVPVGACSAVFTPQNQASGNVHLRERTCTSANDRALGGTGEKCIELRWKLAVKNILKYLLRSNLRLLYLLLRLAQLGTDSITCGTDN